MLDSVRGELRACLHWVAFHGGAGELVGRPQDIEQARVTGKILAEFGVRSKLLTPEEGNDWLAVARGEKACGLVLMKWEETEHK